LKVPESIIRIGRERFLKRALGRNKRNRKTNNFETAKNLGILFEVREEQDYHDIHEFVQGLQKKGLRVKALGYMEDKLITTHFLPVLSFDFIYRKNLNWYGRPGSVKYREFCNADFDILIDLSKEYQHIMMFAAAESIASFKISSYSESKKAIFDMMLEVDGEMPVRQLTIEFEKYINMIKPGNS
jgi:hypothetical protein